MLPGNLVNNALVTCSTSGIGQNHIKLVLVVCSTQAAQSGPINPSLSSLLSSVITILILDKGHKNMNMTTKGI